MERKEDKPMICRTILSFLTFISDCEVVVDCVDEWWWWWFCFCSEVHHRSILTPSPAACILTYRDELPKQKQQRRRRGEQNELHHSTNLLLFLPCFAAMTHTDAQVQKHRHRRRYRQTNNKSPVHHFPSRLQTNNFERCENRASHLFITIFSVQP